MQTTSTFCSGRHEEPRLLPEQVLRSGGELFRDVTNGFGPEVFTVTNPHAFPYELVIHYYNPGPMGYGMGMAHIVKEDGNGVLAAESRPFVAMKAGAHVDLGLVRW